jgi:hypothetical protein
VKIKGSQVVEKMEKRFRKSSVLRPLALDARVYADAALRALVSMGLVLDAEAGRVALHTTPDRENRTISSRLSKCQWMQDWGA